MNWITWVAILVVWPTLGLVVAYLFGRYVRGVESREDAGELAPTVLSYMRRTKRTRTSTGARAANHPKTRREAAGGRRLH